ncbi:dienelactone hydrolase family protein [Propylenella binzhouense]|uniref:Dienelactone hydrolase family protein n=1 Tax=Propylenella binzhouense TaxID=2555902 RepID=A0A964T6R4_9HYPH|nr:dienelactone hydrolase family protein [Propylenella binzhouense]MYZ48432.1 dienelactone hydrolase family protein [Propylenella binzhouense]
MGETISLEAADGHRLGAYCAEPAGPAKAGIVVIQEIFGVNSHIRSICDRLAAEGYEAIAPAIFDRQERDFESGYSPEEIAAARRFVGGIDWDAMLRDTRAAADHLKEEGLPLGIVGFCLGGSVAFAAATRLDVFRSAVAFYGGRIAAFADEVPNCPVLMHFGETDHSIPMSDVETIRARRPDCTIHVYPAGHGFNCDERASYEPESARLAWRRTLDWFDATLRT